MWCVKVVVHLHLSLTCESIEGIKISNQWFIDPQKLFPRLWRCVKNFLLRVALMKLLLFPDAYQLCTLLLRMRYNQLFLLCSKCLIALYKLDYISQRTCEVYLTLLSPRCWDGKHAKAGMNPSMGSVVLAQNKSWCVPYCDFPLGYLLTMYTQTIER